MLFGLLGVGLVCCIAHPLILDALDRRLRIFHWPATVEQTWVSAIALNVRGRGVNAWLLRDEVDVAAWSAARRHLTVHGPTQAVGLSISK